VSTKIELQGTFACPICGFDRPHHHDGPVVSAWRDDAIRADGWTSCIVRLPKPPGFYLCTGHKFDLSHRHIDDLQDGVLHQRDDLGLPAEVLHFSPGHGFWLVQFPWVGRSAPRRKMIYAHPTHWRDVPLPPRRPALVATDQPKEKP